MPAPPPPPPPPPPGGPKGASLPARPPTSAGRGALLGDIAKGSRLKKVQTNDRSAPIVGKTGSEGSSGPSIGAAPPVPVPGLAPPVPGNRARSNSDTGDAGASLGGAPQLGGLLAGGIPKLRKSGGVNTGAASHSPYLSDPESTRKSAPRPPPGTAPRPPGAPPPIPAVAELRNNLRPSSLHSTASAADIPSSRPKPPPIGKKPPLPPPASRKPSGLSSGLSSGPRNTTPTPPAPPPPPPVSAPRPPPARSTPPPPPAGPPSAPSIAEQAARSAFSRSTPAAPPPPPPAPATSPPASPAARPLPVSGAPSSRSSLAPSSPAPPPPSFAAPSGPPAPPTSPPSRPAQQPSIRSMLDVSSYTLSNGGGGGAGRGSAPVGSGRKGNPYEIHDTRWKFQDDGQLPKPRQFTAVPKRYRAGRGSSVPLDLSMFE